MGNTAAYPLEITFDTIWNGELVPKSSRGAVFQGILEEFYRERGKLDILEIGVYRGNAWEHIFAKASHLVKSYTGIDPYLGTQEDPYTGPDRYWNPP